MEPDSDPIRAYIREHGDRYTTEAMRRELIARGHDPARVDAALRDRDATRSTIGGERRTRGGQFWLLVIALHAVALGLTALWIANSASGRYLGLFVSVLVVAMLIGIGISGFIGRRLLPGSGLIVALILPVISALLLGGTCAAMSGPLIAQPRTGTMQVHLTVPSPFEGSGTAVCQPQQASGFSVSSEFLGTLDEHAVSAYVESGATVGGGNGAYPNLTVSISLGGSSKTEVGATYGVIVSTRLKPDVALDGFSGTVEFEGLAAEPTEPFASPTPAPISGSVTWNCK
jgi:hypothetical protein